MGVHCVSVFFKKCCSTALTTSNSLAKTESIRLAMYNVHWERKCYNGALKRSLPTAWWIATGGVASATPSTWNGERECGMQWCWRSKRHPLHSNWPCQQRELVHNRVSCFANMHVKYINVIIRSCRGCVRINILEVYVSS